MRNVIASWNRHGEHELTDDGRKIFNATKSLATTACP
jgi:hypothetical protein